MSSPSPDLLTSSPAPQCPLPKGVTACMHAFQTWVQGSDPGSSPLAPLCQALEQVGSFKEARSAL